MKERGVVYIAFGQNYRLWASLDGIGWDELFYSSGDQTYKVYTRFKYARLDVYDSTSPTLYDFRLYGKEPTGYNKSLAVIMNTDDDSFVFLPTEMVYWDCINKKAYLWTKIPVVASGIDTELFLYYGCSLFHRLFLIAEEEEVLRHIPWAEQSAASPVR